jgi:uncharacterized Ntn-hydrolase superfamily protein
MGVAVQSHWFSVGTVVTWAEPGVGAVATQSFAEPAFGPQGLALLKLGLDPSTALSALVAADSQPARRQVAMVDTQGRVAVHTGDACIAAAGHVTGEGVSVQANMMRSPDVWPAMLAAYQSGEGALAERLMTALDAGEAAGGDVRGRQSAAMLIVSATSSSQPWRDRLVDLRVDDGNDPLSELRRLLSVRAAYRHMESAEELEVAGEVAGALDEYQAARALLPGNDEAAFWTAILMAANGRMDGARALLGDIAAREPGWMELARRLPAAGLLPGGDATLQRLLS